MTGTVHLLGDSVTARIALLRSHSNDEFALADAIQAEVDDLGAEMRRRQADADVHYANASRALFKAQQLTAQLEAMD